MKEYKVRLMEPDDCAQVAVIEKSIFSLPWSEESFVDACVKPDNLYLVCEIEGKIAGYVGVWAGYGEGNITNVAVGEAYRRQGIARALLEELFTEGEKRDIKSYFLEVRESNQAAIALYESLGFNKLGVRKRFYEKPVEDAYVLSKCID